MTCQALYSEDVLEFTLMFRQLFFDFLYFWSTVSFLAFCSWIGFVPNTMFAILWCLSKSMAISDARYSTGRKFEQAKTGQSTHIHKLYE